MWMFISPHERARKFSERASQTGDSRKAQAVLPGDTGENAAIPPCGSNLHVRVT